MNDRVLPLDGDWIRRLDPDGAGLAARWQDRPLDGEAAPLPGIVDADPRRGEAAGEGLRGFWVRRPFIGTAWHQRAIDIPADWAGRPLELFLERCQWVTTAWIDGVPLGSCDSLVAPHVHRHDAGLAAGRHLLTLAVDNANRAQAAVAVESSDPTAHVDLTTEVKPTARLNCGGHHRYPHDWNGVVGRLELRALDPLRIAALEVHPRLADGSAGLRLALELPAGAAGTVRVRARCTDGDGIAAATGEWTLAPDGTPLLQADLRLALAAPVRTWDEFSPHLYHLEVEVAGAGGGDRRELRFGMREAGRSGHRLTVNGRPAFLRGTLDGLIFPLTGHPPMEQRGWLRLFAAARSYGLNHLRFHTCCPPEAAFAAADALGMYLQVELPGTSCPQRDEDAAVEAFLTAELERLLAAYGNHPSLLIVAMGNEQLIADDAGFVARHQQVLERKVRLGRERDPRHLYAATAHPWTPGRGDDLFISAWPVLAGDRLAALRHDHAIGRLPADAPLCGIQWSGFRVVDAARFNTAAPETASDYDHLLQDLDRPLISHEVGQWAVYPDLRETARWHGVQAAGNFALIAEDLRRRGLLERAADFTRASGLLALALYKEEIESALRSARLSGFQLLDLHDYPGQGTSTIGLLNAHWESKGLTTPAAFRAFCAPVVPLARLERRVWRSADTFTARIEVANHGPADLAGSTVGWRLAGDDGRTLAAGAWEQVAAPVGGPTAVGVVAVPLAGLRRAEALELQVAVDGRPANRWTVWAFPPPPAEPAGVLVAARWDAEVRQTLRAGGAVLLLPAAGELRAAVPGTFTPVFWNAQMKHAQPAKTMGLLIDPAHPCLDGFPTACHSDWQWWEVVMRSQAMVLDGLPAALRPPLAVIDSFVGNRRLALAFEARVGRGRLLVCAADLADDLDRRPAARQLRASLLAHLAGPCCDPDVELDEVALDGLLVRR